MVIGLQWLTRPGAYGDAEMKKFMREKCLRLIDLDNFSKFMQIKNLNTEAILKVHANNES